MPNWDPKQYLQFIQQRTQPCIDLVSRIDTTNVLRAVDLGCGPGNSTEVLAKKFPAAKIVGIDNSPDMLAQAAKDYPQFTFKPGDAQTWTSDQPADVILANAVFQWIPNHEQVFPHLLKQLRPGGALAIQMPRNFDSPTHLALREISSRPQWNEKIPQREFHYVHSPDFYFDLLAPICARIDIWETRYVHVMPDHDAIIEWYKGTGMRPYLDPLTPDERKNFIAELREKLLAAYPLQKNDQVLFPFRRIFFIARAA
jgi:trans-aconitate 2-methyltransferase